MSIMYPAEDDACFFRRTEMVENNGWCRGGAWLAMLMIRVRQAQQALRLIATRLSAAGQRLPPHTVIHWHWQRKHVPPLCRMAGQRGAPNWTVAGIKLTDARLNTNPQPLWINLQDVSFNKVLDSNCLEGICSILDKLDVYTLFLFLCCLN